MMNWEEILKAVEVLKHYCESMNISKCLRTDCIFAHNDKCLLWESSPEDWNMEVIENNIQNLLNM